MIVFELICPDQHRFEGWFASADDFDSQQQRGLLSCPACGKGSVKKLLTAKIARSESEQASGGMSVAANGDTRQLQMKLHEVISHVLNNTENVGEKFADEARAIHREEAPSRAIRGTATREQAEQLQDEGVPFMQLPVPPKSDWH